MKSSLSRSLIITIVGIAIFFNAEAWGEDWKLFTISSDEVFWWYDTQSVTYQPDKTIRVWVKRVKAEEIFKTMKSGTKIDPAELEKMTSGMDYERFLMEIDCVQKTAGHLQKLNYDSNGALKSGESKIGTKKAIPPGSVAEKLYKIVCK